MAVCFFTACSEDDLGETNFDSNQYPLDPNSYSFALDSFLEANYRIPYNLQFCYKMQDISADMNYNLSPCSYDVSIKMAVLTKYLWFDAYAKVVDSEFLKKYGPRIIHLIGSPAYNAASGTMILGLAEGGIKVSLYRLNMMDVNKVDSLNELYFKTMHHEFAHILHQTKIYPQDFNMISSSHYDPFSWETRSDSIALSLGLITQYAGSQAREDFVEVIANYIVKDDDTWNGFLNTATFGWEKVDVDIADFDPETEHKVGEIKDLMNKPVKYTVIRKIISRDENGKPILQDGMPVYLDPDGVNGKDIVLDKLNICRQWLKDAWDIDLEQLRMEVQRRQFMTNADGSIMKGPNGRPVGRLTYPLREGSNYTLIDSLMNDVDKLKYQTPDPIVKK